MTVRKARTASFFIDIEKNGFLDDDDVAYKQQLEKQLQLHQQRGGNGKRKKRRICYSYHTCVVYIIINIFYLWLWIHYINE